MEAVGRQVEPDEGEPVRWLSGLVQVHGAESSNDSGGAGLSAGHGPICLDCSGVFVVDLLAKQACQSAPPDYSAHPDVLRPAGLSRHVEDDAGGLSHLLQRARGSLLFAVGASADSYERSHLRPDLENRVGVLPGMSCERWILHVPNKVHRQILR